MKDTWHWLPTADVMYACDPHWWEHWYDKIIAAGYGAELWTQDESAAKRWKLQRVPGISAKGLGKDKIHFGGNSGYQAINLAYLFGARKIVLLGFDMQLTNGKQHFFGQHPYHQGAQGPNSSLFKNWLNNFNDLSRDLHAEGVKVVNASRTSALTCFYKGFIDQC